MTKLLRHIPPYDQKFRFEVSKEHAGQNIIDFYTERFSFRPREYWIQLLKNGDISVNRQGVDVECILKEGDLLHTIRRDVEEPPVNADYKILYNERGLLVLNKPAPLPVHPAGRFYKNSLTYILKEKTPDQTYHTIHRLDTWTTGVLVLATELERARFVHAQVERQEIKKTYGVLATGDFGDKPFTVDLPVGRKDGAHRGTGPDITEAKHSVTHFTPIHKKGDVTLLKAVPVTGRTNQIRVHVQAVNGAVLGDLLYGTKQEPFFEILNKEMRGPASHLGIPPFCREYAPEALRPRDKMEGEISASRGESLYSEFQKTVPALSFPSIPFMGLHCREMEFVVSEGESPTKFIAEWPEGFHEVMGRDHLEIF